VLQETEGVFVQRDLSNRRDRNGPDSPGARHPEMPTRKTKVQAS
jgi:hypothetical protein